MMEGKKSELRRKRRIDEVNQSLLIQIFQADPKQGSTLSGLNGRFLHSQIFMDVLLRVKGTQLDKEEFLSRCKKDLQDNEAALNTLDEFQKNYSSDQALWWYTRETFIYQLLNQALRSQNIDLLFYLRFFIADIQRQLESQASSTPMRVYRGQFMSDDELQALRNSSGQYICTNSFLSTSINKDEALSFLDQPPDEGQRVLFIIDADPRIEGTKPFANISVHSYFTDEQEVLFLLGSIFRIGRIQYVSVDRVWSIEMTLCSDHNHQLKPIFDCMKHEYGEGETGLLTFGRILRQMGKFDQAEKYYQRFLSRYDAHDQHKAQCYHLLGNIALDKGDYDSSLEYHLKSLEIKRQTLSASDASLAYSHNSIGIIHWKKGEHKRALESYRNASQIWQGIYGDDDLKVAMCWNNIGIVHDDQKNFSEALTCYEKALSIRVKQLPSGHCQIGDTYNNIGAVHRCLGNCDLALNFFNQSLEIYEKSLSSQHPSIASTYKNIAITYEIQNHLLEALQFYKKAAIIFHQTLPMKHPDVKEIDRLIVFVSVRLSR